MDDPSSPAPVILLYGDGSLFMSLLARELLQHTSARLILAGRDDARARRAAHALDPDGRRVGSGAASLEDGAALLALLDGVAAVVCCVRSFRGLPATLVDACLARGVAYFDCADSRAYVARVRDRRALIAERGITVGTGLGMTPGISALAVAYAIAELELTEVARIDTAIYVGSRRARGSLRPGLS